MWELSEKIYLTPPDNEAIAVRECFFCGENIYVGDEFYNLDGFNCCEDCLDRHFKVVAELPDWETEKADLEHNEVEEER